MKQLNIKLTKEEELIIYTNAKKTNQTLTDYCKRLILGYEVINITNEQAIISLIAYWQKLQSMNIDERLLEELKQIITSCKK
jgi:hypothetical protein